ncbi:MAG: thermonuclease family protein [Hyphomicrobium sp.]
MQLDRIMRQGGVRRWLTIAALLVIAALGGRYSDQSRDGSDRSGQGAVGIADSVEGHPRLVDGDSFHLGLDEVRLKGIDAPEGRQTCTRDGRLWQCGEASRDELKRLIGGQKIVCRSIERDQHRRLLAFCSAGQRELNRDMVASGMALSYGSFLKEETSARLARRGLWGSQFQRPREWRREHGVGGP